MASPRRGVLAPPPVRFPPGIGGRRRGAGEDIALDLSISGGWLRFGSIDMLTNIRNVRIKVPRIMRAALHFL